MTKKQKLITRTPEGEDANQGDKIITEMMERRKTQQEALKKIMSSIDSKTDLLELPISPEKRRVRIKKLFTSGKNSKKKTR